jgi:hypothetical protein
MSTPTLEAMQEREDDRTLRERGAFLNPEEVMRVAFSKLTANPPVAILDLIRDHQREPYPTYAPHVHWSDEHRVCLAVLQAVQEAMDDMTGMRVDTK